MHYEQHRNICIDKNKNVLTIQSSLCNFYISLFSGVATRLQAAVVHTERRVVPLSAGAEGRRAALHHHRPAGNLSTR